MPALPAVLGLLPMAWVKESAAVAQGEEAGMDNPETKDWKKDLAALRFAVKSSSPAAFESIKVSRAERQTGSKEMNPF